MEDVSLRRQESGDSFSSSGDRGKLLPSLG